MINKKRIQKANRYIDEYIDGIRLNPRVCITEEEAEKIMQERKIYLRQDNIANDKHIEPLYIWKIRCIKKY